MAAARAAAALFLLAGVLALAGIPAPESLDRELLVVAASDFLIATLAWWLPWGRLPRNSTAVLGVAGLAVLAFSTWAFGGFAAGTGPFFVLLFAWVGLHHPPWVAFVLTPPMATAYVAPLVATHQPPQVISSAVVFVPVTTAVAVVIAHRVRQLHRAREQVEAAERWRAALNVTLAHDVRSPLTAVQASLELLEDDLLSGEQRKRVTEAALRQTARITRLASGLLDVGRIEDGNLRLDLAPVELHRAVREAVLLTRAAEVVIDIDPDLEVYADPDRLEQMLVNLTTNAGRHGAEPIVVSATRTDTSVDISVRDHGEGVPEADREALFTRFASADRAPGSVGLGLWIVRQLALAHGGDVRYQPADPGACFVITLPSA